MFSVHTRFQKMHLISDPVAGTSVYPVSRHTDVRWHWRARYRVLMTMQDEIVLHALWPGMPPSSKVLVNLVLTSWLERPPRYARHLV